MSKYNKKREEKTKSGQRSSFSELWSAFPTSFFFFFFNKSHVSLLLLFSIFLIFRLNNKVSEFREMC
jgi:hypothetical protein